MRLAGQFKEDEQKQTSFQITPCRPDVRMVQTCHSTKPLHQKVLSSYINQKSSIPSIFCKGGREVSRESMSRKSSRMSVIDEEYLMMNMVSKQEESSPKFNSKQSSSLLSGYGRKTDENRQQLQSYQAKYIREVSARKDASLLTIGGETKGAKMQISSFLLMNKNKVEPAISRLNSDNFYRSSANPSFYETSSRQANQLYDSDMSMGNFKVEQILGQGSYAVVKLCRDKQTNQRFAVKIYDKMRSGEGSRLQNIKREIQVLRRMEHPNIIRLFYAIDDKRSINLVMEYISSMSLQSYVRSKSNRQVSEREAKGIFRQLASCLKYMHDRNIAHRDIKLDNVLLMSGSSIKLIDFGFAIMSEKKQSIFCGTPSYMSPEMVAKVPHQAASSDIWAAGILFYTLIFGEHPFKGASEKELFRKIQVGEYKCPEHVRLSCGAQRLIRGCLEKSMERRWDAARILSDEWMAES